MTKEISDVVNNKKYIYHHNILPNAKNNKVKRFD